MIAFGPRLLLATALAALAASRPPRCPPCGRGPRPRAIRLQRRRLSGPRDRGPGRGHRLRGTAPAASTSSTGRRPARRRRATSSGARTAPASRARATAARFPAPERRQLRRCACVGRLRPGRVRRSRDRRPVDQVGHDKVRGGAVNVLYGSKSGLTATGDQRWSLANLPGVPSTSDGFGTALASGDFDGDGYWDLAIGVSGRDIGSIRRAGEVRLLYGGQKGLTAARKRTLTRSSVPGQAPARSRLVRGVLAAGDVTGDARAELAVGAPFGTAFGSPVAWACSSAARPSSPAPEPSGGRRRVPGSATQWITATASGRTDDRRLRRRRASRARHWHAQHRRV